MSEHTVIADRPPSDGREHDCQCARCGSSCYFEDCYECEDGYIDRYEQDPLWYGHELYACDLCRGDGGWWCCGSGKEWCNANPLPGREEIKHGQLEWFPIEEEG